MKKILLFAASIALIFALLTCVWIYFPKSECFYQDYLFGAIDDCERLKNTSGEKRFILLGGSSLGFSVSAEKLSEKLGKPVINLGVHAGIGFKNIWKIYRKCLSPDNDVIILSPEYGMVEQIDDHSKQYCQIVFLQRDINELANCPECTLDISKYTLEDIRNLFLKKKNTDDIYYRNAFNAYGDVVSHYHLNNRSFVVNETFPIKQDKMEDYVNFVDKEISAKGFKVIYIPTIVPESMRRNYFEMVSFQTFMINHFSAGERLNTSDLFFPDKYFFNTIYHMNVAGMQRKTGLFFKKLKSNPKYDSKAMASR